ncbi:MAG: hypothetical protein PHX78_02810 [bacterium]|nr:hypothetical protein [bacterium]
MGPAISYINGQAPYKDFLFLHGIYQDPLRSVTAFKLFGKSIGSVRTLSSIEGIILSLLMCIFLIKLFSGNYIYYFSASLILILIQSEYIFWAPMLIDIPQLINVPTRDITTFAFLITILLLKELIDTDSYKTATGRLSLLIFLFSFIPLVSFCYSVDRGFYLSAAYLIISPILYFSFFRKSISSIYYIIYSFLGILSAAIVSGLLLKWHFLEFFQFTFLTMPKYKELLDGFIYHIDRPSFLFICILIAVNTYWITYKFTQVFHINNRKLFSSIKIFAQNYLIEFCLLLLSVFTFRNALGRSDWGHIVYSSVITYILFIYIIIKHCFHNFFHEYIFNRKFEYIFSALIIFIFGIYSYRVFHRDLNKEIFPFKIEDSKFIPGNYKETILFLKNNLNNNEEFFTMTSEAIWYYFIDKPCPTRFSVVWFAVPYFYQDEIVDDLKKKNVKYVLYKNDYWANNIDGINNERRLPIVVDYLKQNYVFFKKIDDNEIWIKNEKP